MPKFHTDIPKLRRGRVGVQFWSVYTPTPGAKPDKYGTHVKSESEAVVGTLEQIDRVHRLVDKYPDVFELCATPAAARAAHAAGKVASVMGAEGGHQLANSMGTLRVLHRLGVRYVTLTHNGGPTWAESALRRDGTNVHDAVIGGGTGLTPFGHVSCQRSGRSCAAPPKHSGQIGR